MLVAVIISLAVSSRREEKKQAVAATEIVRESRPTATRVLSPQDLKIVEAKMELVGEDGKPLKREQGVATARHQIVVRNDGTSEYSGLLLSFTYLGHGDRVLETKTCAVARPVPPGQTESLGSIDIGGVPAAATRCLTKIVYADLK